MAKLRMATVNITTSNIDKIAKLFPNCVTERKDDEGNIKKAINFDLLRQMLSGDIVEGDECYAFTWVRKSLL